MHYRLIKSFPLLLLLVNNYPPDPFHRRQREYPISDFFPKRAGHLFLVWFYLAFGNDARAKGFSAGCWVLAGRSPGSGTRAGDLAFTGRESTGLPLSPEGKSSAPWEVWPWAFVLMLVCSLILEGAVETIRSLNFSEARSKYRKEYISQAGRSRELTAFFWMRSEKADL